MKKTKKQDDGKEKYGFKLGQIVRLRVDLPDENTRIVKAETHLRLVGFDLKVNRYTPDVIKANKKYLDRLPYYYKAVRAEQEYNDEKNIIKGHFITIKPLPRKPNGLMMDEHNERLGLVRVDKIMARNMYNKGEIVYLQPAKVNPESSISHPVAVTRVLQLDRPFNDIVTEYELEHCTNTIVGTYAKFFIPERSKRNGPNNNNV